MPAVHERHARPGPRVDGVDAVRERCADLLRDESKLESSGAERVFFPESTEDVVSAVREARGAGEPITLSGARTGIVGGAVPLGSRWLLSLSRMDRVLEVGFDSSSGEAFARVEAGLSLAALYENLAALDRSSLPAGAGAKTWQYPVDPTEPTAHLGGTVATNASGARSYRYGPTRAWVRALRVVFADGMPAEIRRGEVRARDGILRAPELFGERALRLPELTRPSCKCAAGYFVGPDADLVDVLVGSEGTLAVVTEAELALAPEPAELLSLMCFLPEGPGPDAADMGLALARTLKGEARLSPLSIEYFGATALDLLREERASGSGEKIPVLPEGAGSAVFLEQPCASEGTGEGELEERVAVIEEALAACGGSLEDTWVGDDAAGRERMRLLRHAVPEAVNNRIARLRRDLPSLHKVGTDLAVPDDKFHEMLRAYSEALPASGLEYVVFGHAGENHLHVNFIPRSEEELARAKALHEDLARVAVGLGGAVTAEHGIGRLKRGLLEIQYGSDGVAALRCVKDFFDPEGILNPGVMFAAER